MKMKNWFKKLFDKKCSFEKTEEKSSLEKKSIINNCEIFSYYYHVSRSRYNGYDDTTVDAVDIVARFYDKNNNVYVDQILSTLKFPCMTSTYDYTAWLCGKLEEDFEIKPKYEIEIFTIEKCDGKIPKICEAVELD